MEFQPSLPLDVVTGVAPTSPIPPTCQICLEDSPDVVTKLCSTSCPAIMCRPCLERYLVVYNESALAGIVANVACPICLRPVSFQRWEEVCAAKTRSVLDDIQGKVTAACNVLCPRCHLTTNVLPRFVTGTGDDEVGLGDKEQDAVAQFCRYELTTAELWSRVQDVPHGTLLQWVSWHIEDVERLASIFLRVMRAAPFVVSTCCQAALCFTCKTKDHHDGVSCEAAMSQQAMAQCPNCLLTVVKGDGCDAVVCFCKFAFPWSRGVVCFKFNQIPVGAKALLKQVVSTYVRRRRFRKTVLVPLVIRVRLKLYWRPSSQDYEGPRMQLWKRRLQFVLHDCIVKAALVAIQRHRIPLRRVCEFLRRRVWRRRLYTNVLSSSAFHEAIAHRKRTME